MKKRPAKSSKEVSVAAGSAILAAVLSVGLGLIELKFGNWTNPNNLNLLYIPRGVTWRFDASWLYDAKEPGAYTRDEYGLRGAYPGPGNIDVLTVGGSTTDQRYIPDGRTWQDVLRREAAGEGLALSVVNAGIDGQSTVGHLKNFELWFPRIPGLKPRFILFYVGWNDLFRPEDDAREPDALKKDETWLKKASKKSALFHLYRTIKGNITARKVAKVGHRRADFSKVAGRPAFNGSHRKLIEVKRVTYAGRLRELAARTRELGAEPIFVTQASGAYWKDGERILGLEERLSIEGVPVNGVDIERLLRLMNRTTMDMCRSERWVCVDLEAAARFSPGDFYDAAHLTPAGAERMGKALYRSLKGVLSGKRASPSGRPGPPRR